MIRKKIRGIVIGIMCLVGVHSTTTNADVIELVLMLDGSGSIGDAGWDLQLDAYKNIFASGSFYDVYVPLGDTLHVTASYFSGTDTVVEIAAWSAITDNDTAETFGLTFDKTTILHPGGYTPTELAVITAHNQLLDNGIDGDRMIIDISTDGEPCLPSSCGPLSAYFADTLDALTAASSDGITTNLIGVGSGISEVSLGLLAAAGGGEYYLAPDFLGFQAALEEKLFREINVPAPATLALFGLGLVGLGFGRRKG